MNHLEPYYPLLYIVAGFIAGFIIEKLTVVILKAISKRTTWQLDQVFDTAFRGVLILLFTLTGAYEALRRSNPGPHLLKISEDVLMIVAVLSITMIISRIVVALIATYASKTKGTLPYTSIVVNVTRIVIFALGVLVIFDSLGVSITPILTALGVGGVAVALALQSTLSNLFSGIFILASGQIKPGHFIKLDSGEEGYVVDMTWRSTLIRTLMNNLIEIPNSKLASAVITNYDLPEEEMTISISVGIGYDSDLEKVEKVTLDVARQVMSENPGGVSAFEPIVRYQNFGDSSINLTCSLRVREYESRAVMQHEFIKKLFERYEKEGINIPFPIRTVYLKNENQS
jgi:small-conductance mechanosensitive channel